MLCTLETHEMDLLPVAANEGPLPSRFRPRIGSWCSGNAQEHLSGCAWGVQIIDYFFRLNIRVPPLHTWVYHPPGLA